MVKSPESHLAQSYVARNFVTLSNILTSQSCLFPFHQIFKNEIYYSFDVLVSFHQG